jgi:transcriptional regulator with XRE-family HTH domain
LGAKADQAALATKSRSDGATWAEVARECRGRWGLNARQTIRIARGWSQQQVADEWCRRWPDNPKTFKNISTWERWPERGHAPSLTVLDCLAQIYRCSVADLVADFEDYGCGDDDVIEMDRRAFLAGVGGSLATTALRHLDTPAVAPEVAGYFSCQLRSHWQADRTLGPHLLIDTVVPQCQTVLAAVDATRGRLHRDLLELAAAFTGFVGWLYQDAGDLRACARWLGGTLDVAHRAADPQLVAYALTCKAMLHADTGDGVGAIELAEAALSAQALAPKAQVMAIQQAAHGHALTGDRTSVDRLLDEMADLLQRIDRDDHPWGGDRLRRRSPSDIINVHRATCYGHLGLAAQAAETWDNVSRNAPAQDRRDRGVHLIRHATALLDAGRPEDAARRAVEGAQYLHETGSARMRRELRRLQDKTASWTHTPASRNLHDALDTIVRQSTSGS